MYPFGMGMPGRKFAAESYRYGFQGQERENDIVGEGFAFKYRIHDARVGRFLSVDPLELSFPWNSPYAFSENSVIAFIELEGAEKYYFGLEFKADFGNLGALKDDGQSYTISHSLVQTNEPTWYQSLWLFSKASEYSGDVIEGQTFILKNVWFGNIEFDSYAEMMQFIKSGEAVKAREDGRHEAGLIVGSYLLEEAFDAGSNDIDAPIGKSTTKIKPKTSSSNKASSQKQNATGTPSKNNPQNTASIDNPKTTTSSSAGAKRKMSARVKALPKALQVRPKFRQSTKDYLNKNNPKDANGNFIDVKTGKPIIGEKNIGHQQTTWREYQDNKANWTKTRKEVVDDYNDTRNLGYESASSNKSNGAKTKGLENDGGG